MRILLKIFVLSLLFLGFYDGLQAQRKFSRKTLNLAPNENRYLQRPALDTVILKGSELNWNFFFCEKTTYIEIEGIGRTDMKDIKAGEWHITTRPMKTTKYHIIRGIEGEKITGNYVIVRVVDTEAEIKKVWDEMWKEIEEKRMKEIEGAPTPEIKQILLKQLQVDKKAFYDRMKGIPPQRRREI